MLQADEIAEARWFTREELLAEIAEEGTGVASRVSIARRLIEHWLGQEIPRACPDRAACPDPHGAAEVVSPDMAVPRTWPGHAVGSGPVSSGAT